MADNAFDRTVIHPLEKPLAVDINQAESQIDRALRTTLYNLLSARASFTSDGQIPSSGFVANGLRVVPVSPVAMNVTVKAGLGFLDAPADTPAAISSILGLDDLSSYKPVVLVGDHTFAVPAAPGGGGESRIDIIEVKINRVLGNPISRQILDPATGQFAPSSKNKTLAFTLDGSVGTVVSPANSTAALSYKQGVVGSPGVAPATTSGYVKIAEVRVAQSVTTIPASALVDRRKLLHPAGMVPFSGQWRLQYNAGTPIVTTLSIDAPPSVQVGCYAPAGFGRGEAEIYVVGGELAGGVLFAHGWPNTLIGVGEIVVTYQSAGEPTLISSLSSGEQTEAAAAVPPISVGQTSRALHSFLRSRYQAAGVTNNTNAALEDQYIGVHGFLHY